VKKIKMKKKLIITGVILLPILAFVFHILSSTGFFRTVENQMNGKIVSSIPIAGVEDFTIDEDDNFGIFIAYDRAAERDGKAKKNDGIYIIDLSNDAFEVKLLSGNFKKPLALHGISLIQLDSNHHKLFVINHAEGESIEVFDLYHRDSLVHEKTMQHELIFSPNDIVAISETEFYFTNDKYYDSKIGNLFENYSGIAKCETVYFDGENYRIVNHKNRNLIYIASPRGFLIAVFERLENGDLKHIENIDCGTGVDNIELDKNGDLLIGCHPNLLAFKSYQKGKAKIAPSEIIKINYRKKGDYDIKRIYVNDGTAISASTVAPVYKDLMFVGSVFDDHFLILK
jgi:arylesterase/paraoxonase